MGNLKPSVLINCVLIKKSVGLLVRPSKTSSFLQVITTQTVGKPFIQKNKAVYTLGLSRAPFGTGQWAGPGAKMNICSHFSLPH